MSPHLTHGTSDGMRMKGVMTGTDSDCGWRVRGEGHINVNWTVMPYVEMLQQGTYSCWYEYRECMPKIRTEICRPGVTLQNGNQHTKLAIFTGIERHCSNTAAGVESTFLFAISLEACMSSALLVVDYRYCYRTCLPAGCLFASFLTQNYCNFLPTCKKNCAHTLYKMSETHPQIWYTKTKTPSTCMTFVYRAHILHQQRHAANSPWKRADHCIGEGILNYRGLHHC